MKLKIVLSIFLAGFLTPIFLFAIAMPAPDIAAPLAPWLTGPLLAPSAHTLPPGHINFEPYIYVSKSSHVFDKDWHRKHSPTFISVFSQYQFKWGFVKNFDIQINPSFSWNHSHGQANGSSMIFL